MNRGFTTLLALALLTGGLSFTAYLALRATRLQRIYHYHLQKLRDEGAQAVIKRNLEPSANLLCADNRFFHGEAELGCGDGKGLRYAVRIEKMSDKTFKVTFLPTERHQAPQGSGE